MKLRLFFLIITSLFTILWLIAPINYLIKFTSDDSYFYLKVALNFAKNNLSSFDNINLTNGYHPLWMLILSAVFKIALIFNEFNEDFLLRVVFISTTFINYLSMNLLWKVFEKIGETKLNYIKVILLLIPLCFFYLIGLELQIFIFSLIVVLYFFFDLIEDNLNSKKFFLLSTALSLLILSRIEFSFYIITSFLIYVIINKYKLLKKFLLTLIIPFITFFIYLIINKFFFGEYFQISSKYKLSFDIAKNLSYFPTPLKNPIDFMILSLIVFSGLVFYFNRTNINENFILNITKYIYVASIVFKIVNYFLNYLGVREWYYVYSLFPSILLLGFSFNGRVISSLFFIVIVIFNVIYFGLFRLYYYNHDSAYNFAKEVKKNTKNSEVIYQVDYSGIVSFFSSRKIVNGDGLINSFDYYNHIKKGDLVKFINQIKPKYLVFYSFENINKERIIKYRFKLLNYNYQLEIPKENIVISYPFLYGGLFRKRIGNFYLIKVDEWNIRNY